MNLPNTLTISRIVASPLLFLLFFLPDYIPCSFACVVPVIWVLFIAMELTDVLDGWVARKYGIVTDLGKVLDPFSDVISRLTYFVAFAALGIMHPLLLLLIVYREVSIAFIRMLMYRDGVAMAARAGGKLKAVFYNIGGVLGLVVFSVEGLAIWPAESPIYGYLRIAATVVFCLAVLLSWTSFLDYVRVFRAARSQRKGQA